MRIGFWSCAWCYSLPTASAIEAKPSRCINCSIPFRILRGSPGPSKTIALYSWTRLAPARMRAQVSAASAMPPTPMSGTAPPVARRKSRNRCCARSRKGAPDNPPVSPAWRDLRMGREMVVLDTIRAPSPLSIAIREIASISAGSRSGATLRKMGTVFARAHRSRRPAGRIRHLRPVVPAGPAYWGSIC